MKNGRASNASATSDIGPDKWSYNNKLRRPPPYTKVEIKPNLHCFDIICHVEIGIAQLAIDGAKSPKIISAGLQKNVIFVLVVGVET